MMVYPWLCSPIPGLSGGGAPVPQDLSWLSQYSHEREVLFPPLMGLQVVGTRVLGGTLVVDIRLNLNMVSLTLEEVVAKRRKLVCCCALRAWRSPLPAGQPLPPAQGSDGAVSQHGPGMPAAHRSALPRLPLCRCACRWRTRAAMCSRASLRL